MSFARRLAVVLLLGTLQTSPAALSGQDRPLQADGIVRLLSDLEKALESGRLDEFRKLSAPSLPELDFARLQRSTAPKGLSAVVRERARRPTPDAYEVIVDVFVSQGRQGRVATWQLMTRPRGSEEKHELTAISELAAVDGLVRLTLDRTRQFSVHNLTITAPDLTFRMASGSAFVVESENGITAIVLRGKCDVLFAPPDPAEQGQLRLFTKRPSFSSSVDAAFIRVNPSEFEGRLTAPVLLPQRVDPAELQRAEEIFNDLATRTYNLDLRSLTPERWSLEPAYGSMLVELRARNYGWLTYARSPNEPEDVSFFERGRGRNISVYASAARLAERGRFYSEDDDEAFDLEHHALDVAFDPSRLWVSGRSLVRLRIKAPGVNSVTFRLAQSLSVSSISSPTFGYLLALRVVGQNSVLVSLPRMVERGTVLTFDVVYSGRLDPQGLDREAIAPQAQAGVGQSPTQPQETPLLIPEPRFMYSNRVFWHPQAPVSDYATATMRLTVPSEYQIVASGALVGSSLAPVDASAKAGQKFVRTVEYSTDRPVRYLSCVISRFVPIGTSRIDPAAPAGESSTAAAQAGRMLNLEVVSTPRMAGTRNSRQLLTRVAAMTRYFATSIGPAPYPNFTLAAIDDNLPGGHSPAYFAIFHQPLPTTPYSWGDDPVSFENFYPHFFLAHEVAHQWWGQAIGWKNYHEQWLSEGFAQYFAALYAGTDRGPDTLRSILNEMRDSAMKNLSKGPIYLGYRLGHIENDGRAFRAVVYNKSAVVLHMLRQLIGDDAFFTGVRNFYREWSFKKAGTDNLRDAFEAATPMRLDRFFDRWILGDTIPRLRVTSRVLEGGETASIRIEQIGDPFDLPVPIAVQYADGRSEEVIVPVTEPIIERTIPLKGPVRRISARDDLILAEIVR